MYYLLEAFGFGLSLIPDRGLYICAQCIGWFGFSVLRLRRKVILKNLTIAFPSMSASQRHALGQKAVQNFILTCFEFLRGKHVDLAASVRFEDVENLNAALKKGQGVYILCLHMGNWEAMGSAINRYFCPARVVVKKVGSDAVDRFVSEVRRKNGFDVIKRQRRGDGSRAIVKTLHNGDIVGFVMDQARPGEPKLPFFGVPAKTNTSLAWLWSKRRAPIVPAYSYRTGVGRHVIKFLPELPLEMEGSEQSHLLAATQRFNDTVEEIIKLKPEQYFWFHNRWK